MFSKSMYLKIKNSAKQIIPKRILYKYELVFRWFWYLFYKGSHYQCPICQKTLRTFIPIDNDKLCPYCGSLSRNRRLWTVLTNNILKNGMTVLDFSPSRCQYRAMKEIPNIHYTSTDISGDFIADKKYDITKIDVQDKFYDLIVCYHILEHIEDDKQAIKELKRVLKPDGVCVVQTPFKNGNIYENSAITSEVDRQTHFGQKDHVRIYSVDGLYKRLNALGFEVEVKEYVDNVSNRSGFAEHETILVCRKKSTDQF